MRKTYAWGAIYRVSDRSMPLPALLISEIQQGRPILLVVRVLSFAPVEPNAVSGIQRFENDLGGAMRQLGAIGVGPVVLTGMAVDQGPRSNQSLCKMRIKRQLVLVVGKLEIPRVKPAFVPSHARDRLWFLPILEVSQATGTTCSRRVGGCNCNAFIIDAGAQGCLSACSLNRPRRPVTSKAATNLLPPPAL